MRPTGVALLAGALSAALAGSLAAAPVQAAPATDPTAFSRNGEVLNVLPPGSRGNIDLPTLVQTGVGNLPDLFAKPTDPRGALTTADAGTPRNFADQLEMYDALAKTAPGQLDETKLRTFFKDGRLGIADADVVGTPETPRPGVTIKRDKFGVPHITGATFEDVQFGAGYANISDRMFLTDILRHTGAARMAEFLGPTPGNIAMDQAQLRIAPYTVEQATKQVESVVARYGAEGAKLLKGLDAMIEGMNAAQRALCPLAGEAPPQLGSPGVGFGPSCPVEYAALQRGPTPYTRADIVYIASLVGGIFGKGGGGEAGNAVWYQQLEAKYGKATARKIFDDLREKNDPEAPTTSRIPRPYGGGGVDPDLPGVAMPDLAPKATAPGTGAGLAGSTVAIPDPSAATFGVVDGPLGPIDLGLRTRGMSNALLVGAKHSADGRPTAVFGPQTGYFAPQLLVEQDLQGPGVSARGVSFAGTNLVVQLGHGVDYAWSATSASSDIVDTVIERLCNVDGSPATVQSTAYLVGGTCTPMEQYTHTETSLPNAAGTGAPTRLNFLVLKTRHGIVQLRTTVDDKPVAVVIDRTTYGHEVDSVVGFARLQDPGYVKDAAGFQRAVDAIDFSFNWFYADSRDIAFYQSSLLPNRPSGFDWDLPRWGDLAYDSRGFLPFDRHPRDINPPSGYLSSWNNKPAPLFAAADNGWGYGPVYRSLTLDDEIRRRTAGGRKVARPAVVDATMVAGVTDVRAKYVLPHVLDVLGTPADPQEAKAVALLRAWIASGALRVDRDRDGTYAHQAAIDLLDVWWDPKATGLATATFSLPKDALRGTLGDLTDKLPKGLDDHPRLGLGSAWNGVPWYGYLSKDLRQVQGKQVTGRYSRTYCGGGSLAACRTDLRTSLSAAVKAALAQQSKTDVAALTYDKSKDFIRHAAAGLVGVRGIDWQNRPTFQQAVHFTRQRSAAAAVPAAPRPPAAAPGQLPATGLGLLPLVGVLAVGCAWGLRRREV